MKRVLMMLLTVIFLSGCRSGGDIERAMAFRERLLSGKGCSFDVTVTADYGEKVYKFNMNCKADQNGDLTFIVTDPVSISGITGKIQQEGGKLTFDGQVLAFETLADGYITPVSAPWVFVKALRGGYLASCGETETGLQIGIDDSYRNNALHLDIWLNSEDLPQRCEFLWQGRRVVSLEVRNFLYM